MKNKQVIIGIDVSKASLDVYMHGYNDHFVVDNGPRGFSALLEAVIRRAGCRKEDLFICFENTGKYSRMLSVFLASQSIPFAMEPALAIKRSLGVTRGKSDRVDARRIALYAYERRERLRPTVLPGAEVDQLKSLLTLRERLIKHRTAHKNGMADTHDCYKEGENDTINSIQQRLVSFLSQQVAEVEREILAVIQGNESMLKNFNLMLSVKGVGSVLAFYLLAYTANFTRFGSARKFACYAGIAPFEHSSGTVKGATRVHPLANRHLKSLLNLAAMSAIQQKGEYQQYYLKRTNELGKNKMSTLNIIRNKLVYRVFAVVNRGTPYVDLLKFAA